MSSEDVKPEGDEALPDAPPVPAGEKQRYKSFRKKYRKMRLRFEERMQEANTLFIREHKAWDTAHRLQEQNDQLLDIFLDLNEADVSTTKKRYNISNSSNDNSLPTLASLEAAAAHTLPNVPSPSILPTDLKELDSKPAPGYLTSKNEDEYLDALDSALAAIPPTDHLPIDVETIQPTARSREKQPPTTEDFAHQSSVSVYHWMRRHQPQVFSDGKDKDFEEKGAARGSSPSAKGGRRGKERGMKSEALEEEEAMDADSPGGFGSVSRSSKKNRDETYRPKGGKSRGSAKRKRDTDEGFAGGGSVRKARKTNLTASSTWDD